MTAREASKRRLARRGWIGLGVAVCLCLAGCIFDPDAPCGENQELGEDESCVCAEGFVLSEAGNSCRACGANETYEAGGCVCDVGTFRLTPTSDCEALPDGLGQICAPAADTCPAPFACHADGYCTLFGCASSAECSGGFVCNAAGSESFCQRPPLGQGDPCSGPDDCAALEATYCDSFQSQTCLVEGCTQEPNDCFEGWLCCDFSIFGLSTLCIADESCPF